MAHYKYGNTIESFVNKYRQRQSITQAQLAHMLGVDAQYVSNVERGIYPAPVTFGHRLASILNSEESEYFLSLIDEAKDDAMYNRIVSRSNVKKIKKIKKKR